jgi:hypothetical protein
MMEDWNNGMMGNKTVIPFLFLNTVFWSNRIFYAIFLAQKLI